MAIDGFCAHQHHTCIPGEKKMGIEERMRTSRTLKGMDTSLSYRQEPAPDRGFDCCFLQTHGPWPSRATWKAESCRVSAEHDVILSHSHSPTGKDGDSREQLMAENLTKLAKPHCCAPGSCLLAGSTTKDISYLLEAHPIKHPPQLPIPLGRFSQHLTHNLWETMLGGTSEEKPSSWE